MSGQLVGLVVAHGPENHYEWAVAIVVAEDMHNPGDTALLSLEELADRTRMSRPTVARAVKRLRKGGWMACTPGGGRGRASRYQLLWNAFSTGTETVSTRHPLPVEKGSLTDTVSGLKGVPQVVNRVPQTLPTVTVKTPTTPAPPEPAPLPMLVGVKSDVDDEPHQQPELPWWEHPDALRMLLGDAGVPHHLAARIQPTKRIRLALRAAGHKGHTPDDLAASLAAQRLDYSQTGPGLVVTTLELIAAAAHDTSDAIRNQRYGPPPLARVVARVGAGVPDLEAPCGICGLTRTRCERVPYAISEHHYEDTRDDVSTETLGRIGHDLRDALEERDDADLGSDLTPQPTRIDPWAANQ